MIPAIITDGLSRRIIVQADVEFYTPTEAVRECWETKKSWNRRWLPDPTIEETLGALFTRIRIIEIEEYAASIGKAYRIMKPIDEEDTPFLALALNLDCPIWSNDKHFKRQKHIKTYTTRELARVFGVESQV